MHWILLHSEIPYMHFHYVTHHVVKHKKTGCFLHFSLTHEIEDRSDDFVHTLHVLYFGIESGKDKEDSCQVVVAIGYLLLLTTYYTQMLCSRYQLIFLSTGVAEKRNRKARCH